MFIYIILIEPLLQKYENIKQQTFEIWQQQYEKNAIKFYYSTCDLFISCCNCIQIEILDDHHLFIV